jgi:alpha-D-xyloside xylohydrolase
MKIKFVFALLFGATFSAQAQESTPDSLAIPWGRGMLCLTSLQPNAVRIRYQEETRHNLPEWIYTSVPNPKPQFECTAVENGWLLKSEMMSVRLDTLLHSITASHHDGQPVFSTQSFSLNPSDIQGEPTYIADLTWDSPEGEALFGLGQFQDGQINVRGLMRRLTQVNTQIAIPMLLSNRGYGILWNNYGMTEFNPSDSSVKLTRVDETGEKEVVDVTTGEGNRSEVREKGRFIGQLKVPIDGTYSFLLDVGQAMARRHSLIIDGDTLIDYRNLWLPPTTSIQCHLKAGIHHVECLLEHNDRPVLYYQSVMCRSHFRSPVADAVDFTLFVGSADEVVAAYRRITGGSPLMPQWALGYIHCRERYHSQEELLQNATEFRKRHLPVDVMVQDWQYWGKQGWNAMVFDANDYPSPQAMTDSLHAMHQRLMLSVWAKVDPQSTVGQQMSEKGYFIPGTTWIDFFNPEAAQFYWQQSSQRLIAPYGIDALWQDATEPENDDLVNRRVGNGKYPGELFRNVFPLRVNHYVYNGWRQDDTLRRPMILTRSGFPGIQRYGVAMWSGDVGNDWQALSRQLTAGLGLMAAGMPWWTYDAGGFFRPGNQYANEEYIERMNRWIQASVFLPLMRVHGYMSDTEPWRYGSVAETNIRQNIQMRYHLLPYIYSEASAVSFEGSTLMRPLVFDFPHDDVALAQPTSYMFGKALLVNPVLAPHVKEWSTYLPAAEGGWYDFYSGKHYDGGQYVDIPVTETAIPVMARAGSILPWGPEKEYAGQETDGSLDIRLYPGVEGTFTLYEDEGTDFSYERGQCTRILFEWDDARRTLTIGKRNGEYPGMPSIRRFRIVLPDGTQRTAIYIGKRLRIKL